ncbi:hypothetical protein MXB_3732 [Myxobolus squamalis]|nr:hypothetical protein MXB_3732 [Myxobolus squamalis]
MVGMAMPQYPDIMCPGTCSSLCAPICSEECCTTAIGFKRTLSAYHRNNRRMEPNVLKNKLK